MSQNQPSGRKRIVAFRLSPTEYQILTAAAGLEKRRIADLLHLIVAEALEKYARRLAAGNNASPTVER